MILFVDDDPRSIRPYCDELELRGFECALVASVDEATRTLRRRKADIELVVLDMMMPSGKTYAAEDHDGGLRTGALFYRTLRNVLPDALAILFTNRNVDQLDGPFKTDPLCECRMKEEILPGELADHVEKLLGARGQRPRRPKK
jgi:CheY-like chemotaxis protein